MATNFLGTNTTGLFNNLSQAKALSEVVVEVAAQPAVAKVVREGYQVPPVKFNPAAAEFFLGNLEIVTPRLTPRVVSQSIREGTKVTAGTVVDLVLAPTSAIPFDIFDNVHKDLKSRAVTTLLDGMLADPATRQTVLSFSKAEDVPAADRTRLTAQFAQAGVNIDEAASDANFSSAFNAARGALAFK